MEGLTAATTAFAVVIAALHVYFLVLEMFLWTKPYGMRTFRMTEQRALDTQVLAANQGLYNGFLAAGLIWGAAEGAGGVALKIFFFTCVLVAGLYGGATASKKIYYIQALPAAIALALALAEKATVK